MKIFIKRWLALRAVVLAAAVSAAPVARAQPTVDDFFRAPAISDAELSPSGRYLAVGVGNMTGRIQLGVIDLDSRDRPAVVVAGFSDADINHFQWLNDERLVLTVADTDRASGFLRGNGLWAVNRDGKDFRQLIERAWTIKEITARKIRLLEPDHALLGVPGDGGNDVIVAKARWSNDREFRDTLALRLDTLSGITHPLSAPPDANVTEWMLDEHGEPRAALDTRGAHARLFWRAPGKAGWELLDDSPTAIGQPRYRPLWNEGGTLYVTAASGKDQTAALYRYDTTKRSLDPQALFSTTGFDYDGGHVFDQASGRVVGIRYQSDAAGSYWFDTRLQAAQREIDALLPGTVNRLICLRCTDAARLLISAASDRQPAVYYLFDTKTRKLEAIGSSRPWIDARQMATQDFVRIEARDGLSLPIYVTRPPGKSDAPRPAVVLVHGGPQVRGNVWGWQPITQFLASRGYVVIEPEFRGGNGFGFAHLSAGFRQWGRAMQDDVTDATHWAIRSAGIDPKRICIAGASYGGYAALMGLLREPDLYRCGFEWVGVTDLELMFSIPYSDLPEDWKQHGLQIMLGDPERDKEAMRAVSPLMQAEHIKQPLLLAYGGRDRRVPLTHGVQFHDAVRRSNRDVEWVVYPEEAHGWGALETNRDFWTRVENFLARNIGAATDTAARR